MLFPGLIKVLMLSPLVVAKPIQVDFGGWDQIEASGWAKWTENPYTYHSDFSRTFSGFVDGQIVDIRLFGECPIEWQNRRPVTGSELDGVLSDLLYVSDGFLALRVTGLRKGIYEFFSMHHDSILPQPSLLKISLTDANFQNRVVIRGINVTSGHETPAFSRYRFRFVSDGINPIEIVFSGSKGIWLSGFSISMPK